MAHEFIVLNNGSLHTYNNFDDIPEKFDNLIKFLPEIPQAPHTHDQHDEMAKWHKKLKELLMRETNGN